MASSLTAGPGITIGAASKSVSAECAARCSMPATATTITTPNHPQPLPHGLARTASPFTDPRTPPCTPKTRSKAKNTDRSWENNNISDNNDHNINTTKAKSNDTAQIWDKYQKIAMERAKSREREQAQHERKDQERRSTPSLLPAPRLRVAPSSSAPEDHSIKISTPTPTPTPTPNSPSIITTEHLSSDPVLEIIRSYDPYCQSPRIPPPQLPSSSESLQFGFHGDPGQQRQQQQPHAPGSSSSLKKPVPRANLPENNHIAEGCVPSYLRPSGESTPPLSPSQRNFGSIDLAKLHQQSQQRNHENLKPSSSSIYSVSSSPKRKRHTPSLLTGFQRADRADLPIRLSSLRPPPALYASASPPPSPKTIAFVTREDMVKDKDNHIDGGEALRTRKPSLTDPNEPFLRLQISTTTRGKHGMLERAKGSAGNDTGAGIHVQYPEPVSYSHNPPSTPHSRASTRPSSLATVTTPPPSSSTTAVNGISLNTTMSMVSTIPSNEPPSGTIAGGGISPSPVSPGGGGVPNYSRHVSTTSSLLDSYHAQHHPYLYSPPHANAHGWPGGHSYAASTATTHSMTTASTSPSVCRASYQLQNTMISAWEWDDDDGDDEEKRGLVARWKGMGRVVGGWSVSARSSRDGGFGGRASRTSGGSSVGLVAPGKKRAGKKQSSNKSRESSNLDGKDKEQEKVKVKEKDKGSIGRRRGLLRVMSCGCAGREEEGE